VLNTAGSGIDVPIVPQVSTSVNLTREEAEWSFVRHLRAEDKSLGPITTRRSQIQPVRGQDPLSVSACGDARATPL